LINLAPRTEARLEDEAASEEKRRLVSRDFVEFDSISEGLDELYDAALCNDNR